MVEFAELLTLLVDAAVGMGATTAPGAQEHVGARFNSEVLSDAVGKAAVSRKENDLPTIIASVRIDDVPVLIGELSGPATRTAIEAQLRRYRNQATIARSWLGSEAPNLQLFLIAPPGSLRDSGWKQLAAEVEADDRTCRKLVWLFNHEPNKEDAEAFLSRTFVSRPWPSAQQSVQLDSVANYVLPNGWEEAADDPDLDFDGLVARFIELERSA
ncbi:MULTISPECIES: ABC-three component system middle component 1 [Sinorhizobium]|uniref:ABC-three component system middle component 1 n=1 Tax=Sinorhizobium TaxID=28105 RepID=UPI0001E4A6E2|nr:MULTISPECIES: ABC-three component system middle component 1 [Sinorhizobium]AEG51916.1 hypothetical protein Sinme_0144 [Sinorhizobium meliloti AK83]MDE4592368.1 hypothetical protein [Sinorhizobium meliloti]RVJ73073.1 hypothetical protein CN168_26020 [Sinorhizobium medicae]SEJ25947.1 hypothetical protein SAMN04244575_03675 [Sinorhizobium meliloti]